MISMYSSTAQQNISYNNTILTSFRTTNSYFIAYYPLFLVIIGTILNLLTFIVLCQATFNHKRKQSTIYYMRAIAIFDILMLYGWNFDHFISNVFGFLLQRYSIFSCKILSFLNYFSAQTSAWLRVFMCIDRYVFLTRLHRTWFNHSETVVIIIIFLILFLALFNIHIPLFACYYNDYGQINVNARYYRVYPLWDYINLFVYNCLPFLLMILFNSGVIYCLIRLKYLSSIKNSRIQYRAISITLVLTTFLFLLMTIPATVSFAFFYSKASITLLHVFDSILYTYHISSFPLYFFLYNEFRQECLALFKCTRNKKQKSSFQLRALPYIVERI